MLISQQNNYNNSTADSLFLDKNQGSVASKRTVPALTPDQIFKDIDFQKIEVIPSHQLGKFPIGVESYPKEKENKKIN